MSSNSNQAKKIIKANSLRYENPNEVDGYIHEPYHDLRVSVGLSLLLNKMRQMQANRSLRILELASSTGTVAVRIKNEIDCELIASDIERSTLGLADKSLLRLIQFDATENFPIKTNSIDGIFMGELIEHIFDPLHTLYECYRVLQKSGFLVITTPNLAGLQDRISFLFGIAPRHVNPLHEYLNLHIRPFTLNLLSRTLDKCGFYIANVQSNYVRIRFSSGKHLDSRILAKLFPGLGGTLVVLAGKKD